MTKVRGNSTILQNEISNGITILEKVIDKAPELLFEMDELPKPETSNIHDEPEITMELIRKMVQWDKTNKQTT